MNWNFRGYLSNGSPDRFRPTRCRMERSKSFRSMCIWMEFEWNEASYRSGKLSAWIESLMRRWRILLFVDESSVAGGPSFAFRIVRPWSIGGEPQVTKIALGNEQLTKWNLYQGYLSQASLLAANATHIHSSGHKNLVHTKRKALSRKVYVARIG